MWERSFSQPGSALLIPEIQCHKEEVEGGNQKQSERERERRETHCSWPQQAFMVAESTGECSLNHTNLEILLLRQIFLHLKPREEFNTAIFATKSPQAEKSMGPRSCLRGKAISHAQPSPHLQRTKGPGAKVYETSWYGFSPLGPENCSMDSPIMLQQGS